MAFAIPLVGLLGTAVSAYGTIAGANAQSAGLEYQAKVARQKGDTEVASAQRQSQETKRKADLALSQLQARAAASGAGASDPTVVGLAGDIGSRGQYIGDSQLGAGQLRQWDYEADARGKDASAAALRSAAPFSAAGTILGGAGSLFKAYGAQGGFNLPTAQAVETEDQNPAWWLYR